MGNISERIQSIINEQFNRKAAPFARAIGVSPTTVANYLNPQRASKPTSDFLEAVINNLGVDANWLLTGKGDMFLENKDGIKVDINADSDNGGASAIIGNPSVGSNMAEHDELIRLREENKYLKEFMRERDERIAELKERIGELKAHL